MPSSVNGTSNLHTVTPQPAPKNKTDALSAVNVDDFLKLMIAELQNQDPTNPLDNSQLLNQLGQLTSIESTTKLNSTLTSLSEGQGLANASALIGKKINAMDDNNQEVSGVVSKASITDGAIKLTVGDSAVSMGNVRQILGS